MWKRTGRPAGRRPAERATGGAPGRRRAATVLVLAAIVSAGGAAAEIEVEAHLDREQVALGERLTLTVTVNGTGNAARPELPELPDFAVYPAGTSRNISFVNGKMSSAMVYTYILAPKREGTFEIPPIAVIEGGSRVTSRPLTVTVQSAASAPPPGSAPAVPPAAPSQRGGRGPRPDARAVFLTAAAEPKNPYVGQQVTLTVRFYQAVRLLDRPNYRPPASTGFWVEALPDERTYYTEVEGRRYQVTELYTALFPTESGKLTIGPAQFECLIESDPFGFDPFSLFRGNLGMGEPRTVESRPITLDVRPIPSAGRPAAWSGAVGRYTIAAAIDPARVHVGEASTLTVTLSGRGNIRAVSDPALPEVPGLRGFDSGSEVADKREGHTFGGTRKVTRVLVAETSGRYVIPAITYSVFRPDRGGFETIRTEPLELEVVEGGVAPGIAGSSHAVVAAQGGANLRFIRLGDPGLSRRAGTLWASPTFWLLQLVPLIVLAGTLLYGRHHERVSTDQRYARLRRSGKEARRRLRHARALLERSDARGFHAAVAQAVVGYVADRANVPAPSLTPESTRALLMARGIETALVDRVTDCLQRCDYGRFAPAAGGAERELLAEAEAILTTLGRAGL